MCGIVGVAGEITQDMKKAFCQLLVVDQLRGDHSTGVLSIRNHDGNVKITKTLGGPQNLLDDSRAFNDQYTDHNKVLLGHNRYATSGKVTTRNAHPFDFETVVGVHNGSLRNYTALPGYNKFNVDSEVLYHAIDEMGIERALAKITGAYALVYWDKIEDKMVFIRNGERTLYIAFTDNQKGLMWASEKWMIEGIADRNGIKIHEPFLLKADTLVSCVIPTSKDALKLHVKPDVKGGTEVIATNVTPFRQQGSASTRSGGTTTGGTESGTAASTGTTAIATTTNTKTETAATQTDETHESPIGKRGLKFRAGYKGCDSFGAKYVVLEREGDPRAYRLYLKREDYGCFDSGDVVFGDVSGLKIEAGNIMIYKINNSSVLNQSRKDREMAKKLKEQQDDTTTIRVDQLEKAVGRLLTDEPTVIDGELNEVGDDPDIETGEMFADHNGKYLNKADFIKKHQFCSYCTGNIDPEAGYRFIKEEILCDGCMTDKVLVDTLA